MATVKDSMSSNPITISVKQSVQEAAELMRSNDVGDLIVAEDNRVVGVVTDRDIVVRVIATGGSTSTEVHEACSSDLVTVSPRGSDCRCGSAHAGEGCAAHSRARRG